MERSELDHLVVAATTLANGVAWVESQLGVAPVPGGQHQAMGTHNALLRLGARSYLEVIAIDPSLPAPDRPRWFALDDPQMQARLATSPALITWVLRSANLGAACARVPDLGEIVSMQRGEFHWKIAVPDDGSLPWSGILPAAIEWEADAAGTIRHPCDVLPASGCELQSLALSHPVAVLGTSGIVGLYRSLKVAGAVDLKPGPRSIRASIACPRGEVVLGDQIDG